MLSFSSQHRYYVFEKPTDMRKSFNGLSGIVRQYSNFDLLNGDVFIFINKRCTHIKLLKWDVTGFALYYKRLEQGTFEKPLFDTCSDELQGVAKLTWSDLVLLLEGIELTQKKRRKRYRQNT